MILIGEAEVVQTNYYKNFPQTQLFFYGGGMMELYLVCHLGKYFVSLNTSIFHFFF